MSKSFDIVEFVNEMFSDMHKIREESKKDEPSKENQEKENRVD